MEASRLPTPKAGSSARNAVRKLTHHWLAICQRLLATAAVTLVSAPIAVALEHTNCLSLATLL